MTHQDSIVINSLTNSTFAYIGRACNLIWLGFKGSSHIAVHAQCLVRITFQDQVLLCSTDMYSPREDEPVVDFEWDNPGNSMFEQRKEEVLPLVVNKRVINVFFSQTHDLFIELDNGVTIQIIRTNTCGNADDDAEYENIRVFDVDDDNRPHYLY